MIVRSPTRLALALLAAAALGTAPVASQLAAPEKARLELAAGRSAYAPGETARLQATVLIDAGWHVNSHQPTYEWLIPTELTLDLPAGWPEAAITYPEGLLQTFAFESEGPLSVYEGSTTILADVAIPAEAVAGPIEIEGVLRYQACDDRRCLPPTSATATAFFDVAPGTAGPVSEPASESGLPASEAPGGREALAEAEVAPTPVTAAVEASAAVTEPVPMAWILLLGLLGGLILNAMPCVLPILSLKLFGLVKSAAGGRGHVVAGSLSTAAGILLSFWGLAAAAVVARAAGASVGWGIQFQEPLFVTFLAVVVLLFTLNLWGLFEVPLPGFLARVGSSASGEGYAGHFVSGLFATLMATPCSAPFLGTAISFALGQPPLQVFAVFTSVGVGMALPYLALAVSPGAVRWLPRPGPWMEGLRVVLGFLLAAAAVWLFYVLAAQLRPETLAAIQLLLLLLALAVWARGRATGKAARAVALVAIVALAVGALALASGGAEGRAASASAEAASEGGLISWVPFERARAEQLASEGRLVFVDVTADWCFTCKVNERLVLETPPVAEAFERFGVIAMRADWTNRNDEIGTFLSDHGRFGIPFYLLYRPGAPPHLFAELLTKGEVLEVLEAAGVARSAAAD